MPLKRVLAAFSGLGYGLDTGKPGKSVKFGFSPDSRVSVRVWELGPHRERNYSQNFGFVLPSVCSIYFIHFIILFTKVVFLVGCISPPPHALCDCLPCPGLGEPTKVVEKLGVSSPSTVVKL